MLVTMTANRETAIRKEKVADYHRDGFLILRGIFDEDEVASLASEAEMLLTRKELMNTQNIRCRWQNHVETGECTFDCFDPVIDIGPVCRYFARDERILQPLRQIYDDEAHLF